MAPSVDQPIGAAIALTRRRLFEPFVLGKWLQTGFCAFLMGLADGGAGSSFNTGGFNRGGFDLGGGRRSGLDPEEVAATFQQALLWMADHRLLVISVGLAVLIVITVISLLLLWLASRGRFMFLNAVVDTRATIGKGWHSYRKEGNALFVFRFWLGVVAGSIGLSILLVALLIALPDLQAWSFGAASVLAIVAGVAALLVVGLVTLLVQTALLDFVVPIMYLRRIPVLAAWSHFRRSFLAPEPKALLGYLVMKLLLGIAVGILSLLVILLTCCIALLPYVGSVILLPFSVFMQAYTIRFIEQFGPDWQFSEPLDHSPGEVLGAGS